MKWHLRQTFLIFNKCSAIMTYSLSQSIWSLPGYYKTVLLHVISLCHCLKAESPIEEVAEKSQNPCFDKQEPC